jgi:hypothetical protein
VVPLGRFHTILGIGFGDGLDYKARDMTSPTELLSGRVPDQTKRLSKKCAMIQGQMAAHLPIIIIIIIIIMMSTIVSIW